MIVDAPNTAYALQLYDMLAQRRPEEGRLRGEGRRRDVPPAEAIRDDKTIAASMLNPPFSVAAQKAGLKSLGSAVKIDRPVSGDAAAS